ncbi:MAG: phenylalanine--tRNA ligase subunit beta [Firmicutes bacterium]|nr:phenylalanine--tRNA ligase subunit beta [Candidatus Colimorpha enterica]
MLVSMNWINDYVDLNGENIEELIHRFTLSTAEVEDIYFKGKDVSGVIVAQIVSVENHPNSKKLHLLKVDTGSEVLDIVCGAPNVAVGQKVALATAGAHVPAGDISVATVAGYTSYGMCCAADELGLSDDHTGLMEIDVDCPLGTDIKKVYPIDDIVFEVDNKSLTNRPDLWGHYGIAREFAALTGKELKPLDLGEIIYDGDKLIPVTVSREDLVYRYSCLEMSGISKNVSPLSMRIRLYYCGMRGINLLADLTNYIMLELGQPTHAFDARKISEIKIGTPDGQFGFKTLDDTERTITPDTLMIYNGDIPVAIAGIMGGLDSEIIGDTDSVVLESANFDGISVRKTSSRLGLRTDASMRYEKILDPELTILAVKRFVRLLTAIDPGAKITSKLNDVYVKHYPELTISFDKKYVDRYTGIDISNEQIVRTLSLLGFGVDFDGNGFSVRVPSWRATKDVTIKADIIEEITRIYGYDNFEIKTTDSLLKPVRASAERTETNAIKDILVQRFSMHEVHSYIWQDGKKYKKLGIDVEDNVRILNIATPENGTLRRSMLPTMLTFVSENKGYGTDYSIFEIARIIDGTKDNGECNERPSLSFASYSKTKDEKTVFLGVVNTIRTLFREIKHVEPSFENVAPKYNWQHPKNTVAVKADGKTVGVLCTLHPSNLAKLDKAAAVVVCEIFIDDFNTVGVSNIHYSEPSKFPGIDIDFSLVMGDGKSFADGEKAWAGYVGNGISSVSVIDVFALADGQRSVTVRLSFSSDDRTLSMEEVQPKVDKIISALAENGITIRA